MGRRSFGLSKSAIQRMVSSSNAYYEAKQRNQLINSQIGVSTRQDPMYRILDFDFNYSTRVSHITFLEVTAYRKIDKYVQRNGIKYPIYSDWKYKNKQIKKVIKLDNETLERLNCSEDELVTRFSKEIISKIDNEDLYPSWFIRDALNEERKGEIEACKSKHEQVISYYEDKIKEAKKLISSLKSEKQLQLSIINGDKRTIFKQEKKISKANNNSHALIKTILTLGLYLYLHSEKRKGKLKYKISNLTAKLEKDNNHLEELSSSLSGQDSIIAQNTKKIESVNNTKIKEIESINFAFDKKIDEIEPLLTDLNEPSKIGFIPLKRLVGTKPEKIIGCYVIRNTENGKCYVGQSKNVLNRVTKQHFNGTVVKNIIFAEDYYQSDADKRDSLFEVKIIPCSTKDELDSTEASLIEEYDSFNNGYNSTSGNS